MLKNYTSYGESLKFVREVAEENGMKNFHTATSLTIKGFLIFAK